MLALVAYDITEQKRLAKVAKTCEDYGIRVQYSVFECHLTPSQFEQLWGELLALIDSDTDRIVAYRLDEKTFSKTRTAGTMVCHQKAVSYVI